VITGIRCKAHTNHSDGDGLIANMFFGAVSSLSVHSPNSMAPAAAAAQGAL